LVSSFFSRAISIKCRVASGVEFSGDPLHLIQLLHHLLVGRIQPARFGHRRGDAGLLLDILDHVEQHLDRPQVSGGGFVDQLLDDRLALGDLAPFSVDRDEDLLAQRIGQQRMQLLLAAAAGVTRLPLSCRSSAICGFLCFGNPFCRLSQRAGVAVEGLVSPPAVSSI
jgi:hypothetical protein